MTRASVRGQQVIESVLARHPEWASLADVRANGDVEVVVPAPSSSRAGHLVVFTSGDELGIRYAPPHMVYAVETEREMHAVIDALLADDAFFVVVTRGDEWIETGLYRPGQEPVLAEGDVANAVSWSGAHDKVVTFTK